MMRFVPGALSVTAAAALWIPPSPAADADFLDTLVLPDLEGQEPPPAPDPDGQQRTWLLRYRFQTGQSLRYESTKTRTLTTVRGGRTQTDITRVRQIRRFDVVRVDPAGSAELDMRFESVNMSLQTADRPPQIFDSTTPLEQVPPCFRPIAAQLRDMRPVFVVHPTGAPISESGDLIGPSESETQDGDRLPPETRLMLPLPEHAVAIGDTWKYYNTVRVRVGKDPDREEDIFRRIRLVTICRLWQVTDGVAEIRFQTTAVSRVRLPSVQALLIEALPKGHVLLDLNSGRMTERFVRHDRTVFGAWGPQTLLTSTAKMVETLLPDEPKAEPPQAASGNSGPST